MKAQEHSEPLSERFLMHVSPQFLARLDKWRAKQPGVPNRSEAIRRLVEAGIKQPLKRREP
jgi:metal-responsive CopG/Arc/MetJ family transcriptional regulator